MVPTKLRLFILMSLMLLGVLSGAPGRLSAMDELNQLSDVGLGKSADYTRLVFTFKDPLTSYVVRRDDVDEVIVDFGPALGLSNFAPPQNEVVQNISLAEEGGRLVATIQLASNSYEVRHFYSRDRFSAILDFKNQDETLTTQTEMLDLEPLSLPPISEVAFRLGLLVEPSPENRQAENLFQRILTALQQNNNESARADIDRFAELFPGHPYDEYLTYLKAELDLLANPADNYAIATETWKDALNKWPQSTLAPRGRFMLAEADRLIGSLNEAAAQFKILATDPEAEDYIYPQLAFLRSADLLLNLGLLEEAQNLLEPVLNEGLKDRLSLEAYVRLGMVNFYQGLFSQATEIFNEVLERAPDIYQNYPEMLYAMGESYHYLGRPDLSRLFLMHALNLMPNHPKADVIMARIGDDYRQENKDREAIAIYGAAQRRFPNGDGGVISQVRLADMGSLHSFYTQDKVFDALEHGSRFATVDMYKRIVEKGSDSPLMQLAHLKIGTALAEEGEYGGAIEWLRDLEMNYPRSPLLTEALPILNDSLVKEISLRRDLEDWQAITDLYADSSSYLAAEDRVPVQRIVAQAYEELGRYNDARDMWLELAEQTPERRLDRAKALVNNSLKVKQPLAALGFLKEMEEEFPGEQDWITTQLAQVGRDLAAAKTPQAAADLVELVDSVKVEPVRSKALSDAIAIEILNQNYDSSVDLMEKFQSEYPEDPLSDEYLLTQAQIADRQKRHNDAWDLLSDFRQKNPEDPRVREQLLDQIEKAEELGRTDDVFRFMELYRAYYPEAPESRGMLIARLEREWELGRLADARESLANFRQSYPGNQQYPDLLIKMSDDDWQAGRYDEAKGAIGELLLNEPSDPRTFDFLLRRAEDNWQKERYAEAQEIIDQLKQYYPNQPKVSDLMLKLASANWDRGRFPAAQEMWADFRQTFPNDPRVGETYFDQYQKAVASGQGEVASAAADSFRQEMPDNPLQAELLLEEAKDFLAAGRVDDALAKWNTFRAQYPNDPRTPEILLIQARQEMKSGREADALNHFRNFITQYPASERTPDIYLEAAGAALAANMPDPAWDLLERFRTLYPTHPERAKAILDQAELGQSLGRPADAIALYELFRQDYPAAPQVPDTFLTQARLEIADSNRVAATETLEEGILTNPVLDTDPQVQALLTDLYLELGRVEDWANLVERNLDRDPNPEDSREDRFLKYNQLAQVNQKLGRMLEAERNYDSALANRPSKVAAETLYAIAGAYRDMLRPEKYASTLALVRDAGDPFWQKIATDELSTLNTPS